MDKFMFWKKKKNPADSSAQHLANLLGTSVAGIIPKTPNDKVDLNTELFVRNNMAIASLAIISGLIKGSKSRRELILRSIKPEYLHERSFESYLFGLIAEELESKDDISASVIERRISEYSMVVYGEPSNERSLQGDFFKWSQILDFEPSDSQLNKGIEICQKQASDKGMLRKN